MAARSEDGLRLAEPGDEVSAQVRAHRAVNDEAGASGDGPRRIWPADDGVWRAAVDAIATQVAVLDADGRIVAVNDRWARFAQANPGSAEALGVGDSYLQLSERPGAEDGGSAARDLREVLSGARDRLVVEYRSAVEGAERWFVVRASSCGGPGPSRAVVMRTDITARRRAENQLSRQAAILRAIDGAVIAVDADARVTEWNPAAEQLLGWTRAEMLGRRSRDHILPVSHAEATAERWAEVESSGSWRGDVEVQRRDGSTITVHLRLVRLGAREGEHTGYAAVLTDITARVAAERRLSEQADYLRAVTDAVADGLFVIDRAGRLTYANNATELLLGWSRADLIGDNMHELTHYRRTDGTPHPIAECPIFRSCQSDEMVRVEDDIFIRYDGQELPVAYTASPFHTGGAVSGAVVVFRDISEEKERQRRLRASARGFRWAERVREALSGAAGAPTLALYAQPVVEIATGAVHCEELLLRLYRDGEVVLPAKFLPPASKHGLMPALDRWVVGEAIRLASTSRPVALNLSPAALGDVGLLDEIELLIGERMAEPGMLTFEITETAVIDDADAASRFLSRLRGLGCKVALDDFGTGYSGFTYLKQLPLDYIKIDREFVGDLADNAASQHVVAAIVNLSNVFGHRAIAEGVEDERTLSLLIELGIDLAQGYLLGRPAPAEEAPTSGRSQP